MNQTIDLTGAHGSPHEEPRKRPADEYLVFGEARLAKKPRDSKHIFPVEPSKQPSVTADASGSARPPSGKRPYETAITSAATAGLKAGVAKGLAGGCADASRVLQASDLENSVASLSAALRWRSPAKPHKLPRLHAVSELSGLPLPPPGSGSGRPTAVRGIVDVGAGTGAETHAGQGPAQALEQGGGVGCGADARSHDGGGGASTGVGRAMGAAAGGQSGEQRGGAGPAPSGAQPSAQPARTQPPPLEWGRLFDSLVLEGGGGSGGGWGSQRSYPLWGSASSNRGAAGLRRRTDAGASAGAAAGQALAAAGPAAGAGGTGAAHATHGPAASLESHTAPPQPPPHGPVREPVPSGAGHVVEQSVTQRMAGHMAPDADVALASRQADVGLGAEMDVDADAEPCPGGGPVQGGQGALGVRAQPGPGLSTVGRGRGGFLAQEYSRMRAGHSGALGV